MNRRIGTVTCSAVAVCVMIFAAGCAKKIETASGDKAFDQGATRGSAPQASGGPAQGQPADRIHEEPISSAAGLPGGNETPSGGVRDEPIVGLGSSGAGTGLGSSGPGTTPPGEEPLKGLEPISPGAAPTEEHLQGGTMIAKVEPAESAAERTEEMRREQAETAAAGLADVFFPFDSFGLTEEGKQVLGQNAEWLKAHPDKTLTIEGHCDERGTLSYNLVLGEKRAKAVRTYLSSFGINPKRLAVASFGKERPFCQEHHEGCYQQNRRAHLVVRSK